MNNHEQNVGRNVDDKGHSDEVSDRNEEQIIGNWRKVYLYYEVAKNLADFCLHSSKLWKVELPNDEIGYLGEEISKQSVEGVALFFLTAYSKI